MSKRFFTSDLHLYDSLLVEKNIRQFKNAERMTDIIIKNINQRCNEDDILIHCGDFYCFGNDRGYEGSRINPYESIKKINPMFVNIAGNHDANNNVKSVCQSMRTSLGKKYPSVSISHYPSNNPKAFGTFRKGDIHIHGHVHTKCIDGNIIKPPKYSFDFQNKVLNINVNCELWNYNPVSEEELIQLIDKIMRMQNKKTV